MSVKFSNNGHSTLASSITSSGTSITVASGHGARFPSLSSGEYFYATLIDSSNNLEIVKVTARSSDVLTATRAQESTTARAFAIGDRIELRVTAQGLVDLTSVNLDGDKGDITVSSDGATWSIDSNVVGADELNVSGNGTSGQALLSDGDGTMSWGAAGKDTEVFVFADNEVGSVANGSNFFSYNFTPTISGTPVCLHTGNSRFTGSGGNHLYAKYAFNNGSGEVVQHTQGVGYPSSGTSHNQGWSVCFTPTTSSGDSSTPMSVTAGTQCNFRCYASSAATANAGTDDGKDHIITIVIYES